jgi:hypothetical protein
MVLKILFLIIFFVKFSFSQITESESRTIINFTVLLEKKEGDKFIAHGTGFLLIDTTSPGRAIVITCKHVLLNSEIYVLIPSEKGLQEIIGNNEVHHLAIDENNVWEISGGILRLKKELVKNKTFVVDDTLDIGAFPIKLVSTITGMKSKGEIKISNMSAQTPNRVKLKKEVIIGEDLLIIGYPLGIGTLQGLETNSKIYYKADVPFPVVRSGSVAWFLDKEKEFLADVLSFGGNSGCPVLTKYDRKLIGMVFGHWDDIYKRNFGLAQCIWIDYILPVYNEALKLP